MWRKLGILLLLTPQLAKGLSLRSDLRAPLSELICIDSNQSSPDTRSLWSKRVFDAGVLLYVLNADPSNPNNEENLESMGRSLAAEVSHKGYIFGSCNPSKMWVATTPAPFPLLNSPTKVRINPKKMDHYCSWFRIDYAHARHGKPRRLFKSNKTKKPVVISADTSLLERGTLSVTCKPRKPSWIGPVLWSLSPVKQGPLDSPILFKDLTPQKESLNSWVNKVRLEMGLSALSHSDKKFKSLAETLVTNNDSIHHNRNDIRELSKKLKHAEGKFLGENRVQARSNEEAAWLLWNSPRHRSLLLHKKATHFSTLGKKMNSKKLSVMVFAKF